MLECISPMKLTMTLIASGTASEFSCCFHSHLPRFISQRQEARADRTAFRKIQLNFDVRHEIRGQNSMIMTQLLSLCRMAIYGIDGCDMLNTKHLVPNSW